MALEQPISAENGEVVEYALAGMTTNVNTLFAAPLIILAIAGALLCLTNRDGKLPWER